MKVLERSKQIEMRFPQLQQEITKWIKTISYPLRSGAVCDKFTMESWDWLSEILNSAIDTSEENNVAFVVILVWYGDVREPYLSIENKAINTRWSDGCYTRDVFQQMGIGELNTDDEWFTCLCMINPSSLEFWPCHNQLFPDVRSIMGGAHFNNPTWGLVMPPHRWLNHPGKEW